MRDNEQKHDQDEIFSKALRAGRRTYFFDVRSTRADDYYLTITESKKFTDEKTGEQFFKKHKIYLYKEDFAGFLEMLNETTDFILDKKGEEVISDRHDPEFYEKREQNGEDEEKQTSEPTSTNKYTGLDFEDI